MTQTASNDWALGIAQPLRQLACGGAGDEEIARFIEARKRGDADQANQILHSPRRPTASREATGPDAVFDDVVGRVAAAALRTTVNDVDVRLLQMYVEMVWVISKQIVTALKQEAFWSSDQAVNAVGDVVAKVAFDQINCTTQA